MSNTLYLRNGYRVRDPFREFDTLVKNAIGPQTPGATGFSPASESYRDGDDAVVRLELPGVDVARDVNVEVVDGRLVVSGERRAPETGDSVRGRVGNFRYGAFKRAYRLGNKVTAEQVSASYDAGVLTLRLAGAYARTEGQKIEISTAPVTVPAVEA